MRFGHKAESQQCAPGRTAQIERIRAAEDESEGIALGTQPANVRLQLFDLLPQLLPMDLVLRRVHGLALQRCVLTLQGLNFASQPLVFGRDIFILAFGHALILACGVNGAGGGNGVHTEGTK
jgi:hypothetical protein